MKKSYIQRRGNKIRYTSPQRNIELQRFFFKVTIDGEHTTDIVAEQIPDFPPESSPERDSQMHLIIDPATGDGFFLNITWYPYKPGPNSEYRKRGLLAVHEDILRRLDPDLQRALRNIGIGHAPEGSYTITENTDD